MTENKRVILHCPCGLLFGRNKFNRDGTVCPGCSRIVTELPTSWSDKPRFKKTKAVWDIKKTITWLSLRMNPDHLIMLFNAMVQDESGISKDEIRDGDEVSEIQKSPRFSDHSPQMQEFLEENVPEPKKNTSALNNIALESSLVNQVIAKLPKNGHEWHRISVKRRENTYGDKMVIVGGAECMTCKSNVSYNFSSNCIFSSKDNNKWINDPRFPALESKCPIKYSCNECKDKHIGIYSIAPKRGI